ncbi:hypothetical protein FQA47_015805 [Oryzias melastigma]|uniref:Uncharacterized protein n=1 Tax=Oryzias melastigma TaxID=30732 RepID=A0A834BLL6_ORYME|nr:hypothetical protein FQA47_015805 [Oryzias melastigma]
MHLPKNNPHYPQSNSQKFLKKKKLKGRIPVKWNPPEDALYLVHPSFQFPIFLLSVQTHFHHHTHSPSYALTSTQSNNRVVCCSPTCCITDRNSEEESVSSTFVSEKHLRKGPSLSVNVTQKEALQTLRLL